MTRFTEMENAQIEVQMQRRKDMSVNLSHMVIDYARHEREMFKYAIDKKAGGASNVNLLEKFACQKRYGRFECVESGISANGWKRSWPWQKRIRNLNQTRIFRS